MTQKDDDGQEWEISGITSIRVGKVLTIEVDSYFPYASVEEEIALRDRILADHRNAQQFREQLEQERHYKRNANQQAANLAVEKVALEERVRVLEEALRDINETVQGHFNGDDLLILRRWLPALLPSPVLPGSTEGGEGA